MGYSSSSATLLTAIAGLHKPDGSTPTNTLANVALSAHINQGDPRDDHIRLNHRLGVLHTVSGGVDGQGSFIPDKSLNFNPAGPNAASAAWFGKKTIYGCIYIVRIFLFYGLRWYNFAPLGRPGGVCYLWFNRWRSCYCK